MIIDGSFIPMIDLAHFLIRLLMIMLSSWDYPCPWTLPLIIGYKCQNSPFVEDNNEEKSIKSP